MEENSLKNIIEKLGLSKKQGSEIDTSIFKIKENTIYYSWNEDRETALQISNISQIDVGPAPREKISGWMVVLLIVGLCLMSFDMFLLGLVLAAASVGLIYLIVQSNKKAGDNLIIHLNNGRYFLFNFKDKAFLLRVFQVLIDCINHKIQGETVINISNSTIQSSSIGANNSVIG